MPATTLPPRPNRRLTGLAATAVLHLLLLWAWRAGMQVPAAPETRREAIAWIDVKLAPPPRPKPAPPPATPPARKRTPGVAVRATTPAAALPAATSEPVAAVPAPAAPPAQPQRTAAEMLEQARRDIGKFDKELRKEFARKGITAPTSSPQQRLAQGIEDAYDAVPPKWYESAKVKEIIDPGQYGRKRYKITTAFGTYCMTYESPNSPTAQLDIGKRVEPKMTNCPVHEQSATEQKW